MLVLDFDGTVTDAEAEGKPFRTGYLEDLAALTGRSLDEISSAAARIEADIQAAPDRYGWEYGGKIVAPAMVDPYLRIMPVARQLFDEYGVFRDPVDRTRLLDNILYKYNYQKTDIVFRPGAAELFAALRDRPVWVVTNSHTEPVRKKIRTLGPCGELDWLLDRVRGRAQKYVVDEDFDEVPSSMSLPGLARPVLLRRRRYYEVLAELLDREDRTFADLLVIGDIFELDLALPLVLGARVGLVVNPFTPRYERDFLQAHERGHILHSLSEVVSLLR